MPRRLFNWGKPYLLTDLKERVFVDEPAVCVYKHDSDMKRPTMCAVCGEPLRSTGYYTFCMIDPSGYCRDMMIGGGCLRERISAKELNVEKGPSPKATLERIVVDFPQSGKWYGTFLHHCIAKPYVRNKANAEEWDESILKLPGVRYIMSVIDNLRDEGWKLDAEMHLECGNVDLLAVHPNKGTMVLDWKSDQCFDSKEAYFDQVNRYMAELHANGFPMISGYILWIKGERREYVPFRNIPNVPVEMKPCDYVPTPRIKCTLNIDMDGGEDIGRKRISEYSHHRTYGDEVSFFIRPFEPERYGYEFVSFEAPPYREGERPQCFNGNDLEEGLRLGFICSKKRHTFAIKAEWRRMRPFECTLALFRGNMRSYRADHLLHCKSKIDEDGNDYAEFEVSQINRCLNREYITHAKLFHEENFEGKDEWREEELQDGMIIRIPCEDECTRFQVLIETKIKQERRKDPPSVPKPKPASPSPGSWEEFNERRKENPLVPKPTSEPIVQEMPETVLDIPLPNPEISFRPRDPAEFHFTPGRVYKSGNRFYGIYKRKESDKSNTAGIVDMAEVSPDGSKLSELKWRYIYRTYGGKEFIYGISDTKWKIYTKYVLTDIVPKDMNRFGKE